MSIPAHQSEAEGRALLHYVLGEPPEDALVDRYSAALQSYGLLNSRKLPSIFVQLPFLVRFVEPVFKPSCLFLADLDAKLTVATAVAEASTQGAREFCSEQDSSAIATIRSLCWLGILEAVLFPVRLVINLVCGLWSRT